MSGNNEVDISNSKEAIKNINKEKTKNNTINDFNIKATDNSEQENTNIKSDFHWITVIPIIPCIFFIIAVALTFILNVEDTLYEKLILFSPNFIVSFIIFSTAKTCLRWTSLFIFVKTLFSFLFLAFPTIAVLDNVLEVESYGFHVRELIVQCLYLAGGVSSVILDCVNNKIINRRIKMAIFEEKIKQNYKSITYLLESFAYCLMIVGYRLYFNFYFGEETTSLLKVFEFPEVILYRFKLPYLIIYIFFFVAFLNILLLLANTCNGTTCCWLIFLNFLKVFLFLIGGIEGFYRLLNYLDFVTTEGIVGAALVIGGALCAILASFFAFTLDFNEFKRLMIEENNDKGSV